MHEDLMPEPVKNWLILTALVCGLIGFPALVVWIYQVLTDDDEAL